MLASERNGRKAPWCKKPSKKTWSIRRFLLVLKEPAVTEIRDLHDERKVVFAKAVRPCPVVPLIFVDPGKRDVEPDLAVRSFVLPDGPTNPSHADLMNRTIAGCGLISGFWSRHRCFAITC